MLVEEFPPCERKVLAEGRCARAIGGVGWWDKVEWPLEEEGRVMEGNGVGPGNVFEGIRCG